MTYSHSAGNVIKCGIPTWLSPRVEEKLSTICYGAVVDNDMSLLEGHTALKKYIICHESHDYNNAVFTKASNQLKSDAPIVDLLLLIHF